MMMEVRRGYYYFFIASFCVLSAFEFVPVRSLPFDTISLNSTLVSSTVGGEKGIFTSFSLFDNREAEVGTGGQKVVELQIPTTGFDQEDLGPDQEFNLEISTCKGTDFDTYVALLDKNPLFISGPSVVSESANDLACADGRSKAALTTKVLPGTYYILVTGNGAHEGKFNLSVTGAKVTPTPIPWGLDRVDQRTLPLDKVYSVKDSGDNVWIYVIDSGVRISHSEFEGRAHAGYDFVNNINDFATDCTGHGTHVAGIIAGKSFGISRKAQIVAVKVFGCDNKAKLSAIVNAAEWVLIDSKIKSRTNVVVALMFNMHSQDQPAMSSALRGIERSGIPVVVPAGNQNENACDFYPSSLETALTVGSTEINDDRSQFSNYGGCIDLFAPGGAIQSCWHSSDTAWRSLGGTAQASAHVAGIVGNLMAINSGIRSEKIRNVISSISTLDVVGNTARNESTRLAFVRSVPKFSGDPPQRRHVFLFSILDIEAGTCDASSDEIVSIRETFTDILSITSSRLEISCVDGLAESSKRVQLRVLVEERKAASTFVLFEKAITSEKGKTEESLGFRISVVELPWTVDSTPTVIWGAPSFSETESQSWSAGAIAGIVAGVFCVLAVLSAISWIAYRRVTKADEVQSMEGSADFERGPVYFDDFGTAGDDPLAPRSFRHVLRSMSFRRSASMRGSFIGGEERGINKMGSFIGGPNARVARDMVRVQSFGGEAFAGLASISRSSSTASFGDGDGESKNDSESGNRVSFRGPDNAIINSPPKNAEDSSTELTDESIRMHSFGGEAFAEIAQQLRNEPEASARDSQEGKPVPRQRPEGGDRMLSRYDSDEGPTFHSDEGELSFFGTETAKGRNHK